MNRTIRWKVAALAAAVVLAACGGGDDKPQFEALVSFGDSLSDVGTHNVGSVAALGAASGGAGRWTINSRSGGEIWTERIAAQLGVGAPCAAETGLSPNIPGLTGAPITDHAGCLGYAQGSARVSSPLGPNSIALQALGQTTLGLIAKPIANQMAAHLAAAGGRYGGRELVTVLAGANDVFMELAAGTDPVLAVSNVAAAGAELGRLIRTQVVDKGANYVLVLNVPDIAGTPKIRSLEALQPGVVQLTDAMVQAFNAQLAAQLKDLPQVRLGDAYAVGKDQAANPRKYGLSNVTTEACLPNVLGNTALVCNASNTLAADVSRYLFADDVHPTPYGHQLMADLAARELERAGWR